MLSSDPIRENNALLSEDYLKFVSLVSDDKSVFDRTARAIREAQVDIRAYFLEHGDLEGLQVAGIGPSTRVKLVPILRNGIDAVLKMTSTPVDRPLDRAVFQKAARAAVEQHRNQIREGE